MSNFDSIDAALDCDSTISREPKEHDLVHVSDEDSLETNSGITTMPDAQKDYDYARAQLYSLIEKGQEAVNGALSFLSNAIGRVLISLLLFNVLSVGSWCCVLILLRDTPPSSYLNTLAP